MFLRGSPERILYDRWLLRLGLLFAIVLSGLAQMFYHGDHVVFVLLRVFAELITFMLWMVVLTGSVGRLRLAQAMMVLVWISTFADVVLASIGLSGLANALEEQVLNLTAIVVSTIAIYGAANTMSWAMRKKLTVGGVHLIGYALVVWALDAAFRGLYNMAAFA